jgi:hypothetical protein
MKIKQLSVFLENKPGRLSEPCTVLAREGINIVTLSLADTREFCILHLIVRDWERARDILTTAGFVVNVTDVVAIDVEDKPGGLAHVLEAIEAAGLNIAYMYAFSMRSRDRAVLVFRFDDPDLAIRELQARGLNIAAAIDLM